MRTNSRTMQFAICVKARPDDDLQVGRIYRVLQDSTASEVDCLRVIDESGEDYLYPASRFVVIDVPKGARSLLLKAAKSQSV